MVRPLRQKLTGSCRRYFAVLQKNICKRTGSGEKIVINCIWSLKLYAADAQPAYKLKNKAERVKNMKFGFIGTGNMGGALAQAVAKSVPGNKMFLADRNTETAEALACAIGAAVADNAKIAAECDFIVLGVKPQVYAALFEEIAPVLKERDNEFVLISMAAGVQINKVQKLAGYSYPVIRIMPNTPASVGEGMILYTSSPEVSSEQTEAFLAAFEKAGILDALQENLIDAASAVSGCGPAFVYMFAEALADGAVRCGLPRDKAILYAAQTLKGAAQLLIDSGAHPGKLKDAVCSPGGSTIAGVQALENGAFRASVINAVCAAYDKTVELGK